MSKFLGKVLGTDKVIEGAVDIGKTLVEQRYTKGERAQDRLKELEMLEASRNAQDENDLEQIKLAYDFIQKKEEQARLSRQAAREFDEKRWSSGDFLQRNASILVGLTLIAFCFSLILILVLADPPIEARLSDKVLDMSSWIILAVTGYFLGSSQGSAVKNRMLEGKEKSRE